MKTLSIDIETYSDVDRCQNDRRLSNTAESARF